MIALILVFAILLAEVRMEEDSVYTSLKKMQSIINNQSSFCYGTKHSRTKQDFVSNAWAATVPANQNVLVYPFCITTNELGNRLGNYFQEIACAEASGINFVAVHKEFNLMGSFTGNVSESAISDKRKLAYLSALPDIIIHKNPVSRENAVENVKQHCKCTRYCWGDVNAPWVTRTDSIKQYLQVAIKAYRDAVDQSKEQTVVSPDVDITNAKPGDHLPIVPDVAIQYRCGDNIGFSYHYGILPFTAFPSRIPLGSKYIYVLSDHPSRAVHSPYSGRCQIILQSLFEYLQEKNPGSTIVVKRGGDLFLDQVRLGLANTTICSASSYCFWPALSNPGISHFPVTSLIAGADSIKLAPSFGPNFKWIESPEIISNLKHYRPWNKILDVLTGKVPPP